VLALDHGDPVLAQIVLGDILIATNGLALAEQLYDLHKSNGAVLIPIILDPLFYRWGHPPPPLPADIPGDPAICAHTTHYLLYRPGGRAGVSRWIERHPIRACADHAVQRASIWPETVRSPSNSLAIHKIVGHLDRGGCRHAYRRGAVSSFCAQGPRPHALISG